MSADLPRRMAAELIGTAIEEATEEPDGRPARDPELERYVGVYDSAWGQAAILRWHDDGWIIQRDFDWADHVNAYWDEALNVNHYDALLYKHMHATFVDMCPMYWERPELYTVENEEVLKARYAHLQLRDTSELRLDSLCPVQAFLEGDTSRWPTPAGRSELDVPASP